MMNLERFKKHMNIIDRISYDKLSIFSIKIIKGVIITAFVNYKVCQIKISQKYYYYFQKGVIITPLLKVKYNMYK